MNKLFYLSLACLSAMLFAAICGYNIGIVVSIILILMSPAVCWIVKEKMRPKITLTFIFIISFSMAFYSIRDMYFEKIFALVDETAEVTATVLSYPTYTGQCACYDIKVNDININNINHSFKVKFYTSDINQMEPNSMFRAPIKFFDMPNNSMSIKLHFKSKKYNICASNYNIDEFYFLDNDRNLSNRLLKNVVDIRLYLKNNILACFDEYQGDIMVGMILGDKSGIDSLIKNSFSEAGISHVLAVSGLHITILIQALFALLSILKLGNISKASMSIIFTVIFISVTGFSPSAVRAGIMNIVYLLGTMIGRKSQALNSLGLAIIMILMINPFASIDMGFQLSFVATLGIIVLAPKLLLIIKDFFKRISIFRLKYTTGKVFSKIMNSIFNIISISVSATIFTAPITIFWFGQVSLIAPLTNILLTPIIQITMITTMITAAIGGLNWLDWIYKFFALVSAMGVTLIRVVADLMASLPFAYIKFNKKYIFLWMISCFIIFIVNKHWLKNQSNKKFIIPFCIIILLIGKLSNDIVINGTVVVDYIGDSKKRNYIFSSRDSSIIIFQDDKFLVGNIDNVLRKIGNGKIGFMMVGSEIGNDKIVKLFNIYNPRKIVIDESKVDGFINMLHDNIISFEKVKDKNIIIYKKSMFRYRCEVEILQDKIFFVDKNLSFNVKNVKEGLDIDINGGKIIDMTLKIKDEY